MKQLKSLTIETCNICNANCIFCGYQYMERKKQVINDSVYKKAVSDFALMGGGNLSLTVVVGDPLLDPNFIERVKYARAFREINKISTVTNCLNLHNHGSSDLLNSGLNEINISTTGFDPEMYSRIYRSSGYVQMKQNLLDLLRTNHKLGNPVKISISLRIDKPLNEILSFPDFKEVSELADVVDANYFYDNWCGRIKPELLTGNMKIRPSKLHFMKKRNPCSMMYANIGILVDGTATACPCRDLNANSDLCLGNIVKTSLSELYYKNQLQELRNKWLSGQFIPDICRDCTHYNPYTYAMLSEIRSKVI